MLLLASGAQSPELLLTIEDSSRRKNDLVPHVSVEEDEGHGGMGSPCYPHRQGCSAG